jgi:uncharacterized protein YndB with AHSA1/START domain
MARQQIHVEATSTASPAEVWRLLADVTTWTEWAGFTEAGYEQEGTADRHGAGAVRRFKIGPLRSRERVLVAEAPRTFAYDYEGTLPIKDYRAEVTLTPTAAGGTQITWHSEFGGRFPLAAALVRPMLATSLRMTATRLARAAVEGPTAGEAS